MRRSFFHMKPRVQSVRDALWAVAWFAWHSRKKTGGAGVKRNWTLLKEWLLPEIRNPTQQAPRCELLAPALWWGVRLSKPDRGRACVCGTSQGVLRTAALGCPCHRPQFEIHRACFQLSLIVTPKHEEGICQMCKILLAAEVLRLFVLWHHSFLSFTR